MRRIFLSLNLLLLPSYAAAESIHSSRVIRIGEVITLGDIDLRPEENPGAAELYDQVIGLEARVTLYANRPIRLDHIGPPTLVVRNQPVAIVFAGSGLRIEVEGRAMDRGSLGETVRVMNLGSRRTVSGIVMHDGNILVGGEK
jgi:flagella basal body P-ring formation protein FlgA